MRGIIPVIVSVLLLTACSSIDCPLNNTVFSKYVVSGQSGILSDTLTVYTINKKGKDITMIDPKANLSEFLLEMSYDQPTDTIILKLTDSLAVTRYDTLKVSKNDICHFESVECPPVFFHTLTSVEHTHNVIDSIIISKSTVNYDTTAGNFKIYFKPGH